MKTQIAVFLSFMMFSWAEPAKDKVEEFIIPWKFVDSFEKDSQIVIYDITQLEFVKGKEKEKKIIFHLIGRNSILLEFDRRDEDVWAESVIASWKANSTTQAIVNLFDLRDRVKPELRLKNFPNDSAVVVFYKLGENGVENWIRVYEPIVNGELQCQLLDFGVWVCVALDRSSKPLKEPARIVNLKKSLVSTHFWSLPESPERYIHEIEKASFIDHEKRGLIPDKNIEKRFGE